MIILRMIHDSIKQKGLRRTIYRICNRLIGYAFDIKYRTNTTSHVRLKDLEIQSNNKERGVQYEPTNIIPLKKLFNNLKLPVHSVFVDLGCGKGRVLLIASEFGFKEVRGIEFSYELCNIAKKNWSNYKRKIGVETTFQIIESDVVDYTIKNDENVFFMFNPFDEVVLRKILENITVSLKTRSRKIWFVYRNPKHINIIAKYGGFVKLKELIFWGDDFMVYSNIVDEVNLE